jgi:hypothetical protein
MQSACAILSSVACPAAPYFSTLIHKRLDFRRKKKVTEDKCVFLFPLQHFSETFLIPRRSERDVMKNVYFLRVKHSLFLLHFNKAWIFWTEFRKIFKYQISWKSVQREPSCSMRKDGRTDGDEEVNVIAFRNIMNALENISHTCIKMFALCHRVIQTSHS